MTKQKTTFNIEKDLLQLLKKKAIDSDLTQTELITLYLKYGLSNHMKIKTRLTEKQYTRYKKRHLKQ